MNLTATSLLNTLGAALGTLLVQSSFVRALLRRAGLIPSAQNAIRGSDQAAGSEPRAESVYFQWCASA